MFLSLLAVVVLMAMAAKPFCIFLRRRVIAARVDARIPHRAPDAPLSISHSNPLLGPTLMVRTPTLAREVLRSDDLRRWIPFVPRVPESLFISEPPSFRRHRQVLLAAMGEQDFGSALTATLLRTADRLVQRLREDATVKNTFAVVERATGEAIRTLTFGDMTDQQRRAAEAVRVQFEGLAVVIHATFPKWLVRLLMPKTARVIDDGTVAFHALVERVVAAVNDDDNAATLLELLVRANTKLGNPLTQLEILANCVSFSVSGNDSTASAMTSVLLLLARSPDTLQARVRRAVRTALPSLSSLSSVPVVEEVDEIINEALQHYPPFPMTIVRYAERDTTVGGHHIPKGLPVMVDLRAVNRAMAAEVSSSSSSPREGPSNSNAQQDQQQQQQQEKPQQSASHMSFGHGARSCVARRVAISIMRVWTCVLLTRFSRIEALPNCDIDKIDVVFNVRYAPRVMTPRPALALRFVE